MLTNKPQISLEILPNLNDDSNLFKQIKKINPEFVSIARGFDGSNDINELIEFCDQLKNKLNFDICTHIVGRYLSKDDVINILDRLKKINVSKVLLLRGDLKKDFNKIGDFKYANELIKYTKEKDNSFKIMAACYPEKHPEALNIGEDINHLKNKVDQGVDQLITQFGFDNNQVYSFSNNLKKNGISLPISVGVMPIINYRQIKEMVSFNHVSLPSEFRDQLEKNKFNPEKIKRIRIDYTIRQIIDLINHGFKHIHLYTMNDSEILEQIWDGIKKYF